LRYDGTIRKNKGAIPEELTDKVRFQPRQRTLVFDDNTTLPTQFCPNKSANKLVTFSSSMYRQADINENGKQEIIMYCNQTKRGV